MSMLKDISDNYEGDERIMLVDLKVGLYRIL